MDGPGTEKAKMLRGDLYDASDPELTAERDRCARLVELFNGAGGEGRDRVLRSLLGAVGAGVEVKAPLRCDYGYNISIGDRSFVNFGAVMLDVVAIRIGADVQIATNVQLLAATHPLDAVTRRSGLERGLEVTIGDGAWLGAGVIVCPGVSIGAEAVVGAGSVVTRDVGPGVLAVGNPCREVRRL